VKAMSQFTSTTVIVATGNGQGKIFSRNFTLSKEKLTF